ncbi:MAG: PDZ domain-containing protein [Acidimicrobiales bacterium]
MRAKLGRRALLGAALALIAVALAIVPLPLYVISPGPALAVAERVELARPADEVSGRLLLTTVRIARPSALGALGAWLDDDRAVTTRESIAPAGVDEEEYLRTQRRLFDESARVAAAAGLRAAGYDAAVTGRGAQVAAVLPGSPADGRLREGDVIVSVDGQAIGVAAELIAALSGRSGGREVTLGVQRGDEPLTVRTELERLDQLGRPGLGVAVRTVGFAVELPFEVDVDAGNVGGPSGGLMIALAVYELADPGDLTAGRVIAGTGTIDADGAVGPVGGVAQKVTAADRAGAELFLAPAAEAAEARVAADGGLEVVAVRSLTEAIGALAAAPGPPG